MLSLLVKKSNWLRTLWSLRNCNKIGKNPELEFPFYSYGLENVTIGDNFKAGQRLKLRAFSDWNGTKMMPQIAIGDNVHIETDCHIGAINSIEIGDNVLMASHIFISDHSHGNLNINEIEIPPLERPLYSKGGIKIGKNSWIGEKVSILPNVHIGESCIIGANSVVTHDIPSFSVAAGVPARVIKKLKQ